MPFIAPRFYSYALTPQEEALCARIGYERQAPMFAQPERNRNYYEGEVWEMWQHAVCAGAELAFARMLGLNDFVPHVNKFKTEKDVDCYEVRYTFGSGILRLSDWDSKDDIYVLLADGMRHKVRRTKEQGWKGTPYRAVCWADGHHIAQHGKRIGKGWRLPVAKAFPMEELG